MINKSIFFILIFVFINLNSKHISVGLCIDKGPRNYMEDKYRIINRPETDEYFFGVFDGHGGCKVADYLANILHPTFLENFSEGLTISDALTKSFESIDKDLDPVIADQQGSTSLVAIIKDEKLYVANAGDSRAVLCRDGKAIDLSFDHKPDRPAEMKRIQKLGGKICYPITTADGSILQWSKIVGGYQFLDVKFFNILKVKVNIVGPPRAFNKFAYASIMTRVIGDKVSKDILTATPEITITDILPEDEFVIMASDGIWDVITSQFAVSLVKEALDDGKNADYAAKMLKDFARVRGSTDNITVLIIK